MKPFDLEKAKNGAAVCLSDGKPVKILDFDYGGYILCKEDYVDNRGNKMPLIFPVNQDGRSMEKYVDENGKPIDRNIYMAPICGYMVLYKTEQKILMGSTLHNEKEKAEKELKEQTDNKYVSVFSLAKVELLED